MVISHNMVAINANRQYGTVTKSKAKTTEKLASGYKINRAADDAAGLQISEKMRRQIRGLTQGVANTEDGVSLCQLADGALAEVNDMLHRITELSVKSANGTNTEADRQAIQKEIKEILLEIDRVGESTEFNTMPVFHGADKAGSVNGTGTPGLTEGDIPFDDYKLANISLGNSPFQQGSGSGYLGLQAMVNNPTSVANGKTFNLIFGSGSTSTSSMRLRGDSIVNPGTAYEESVNIKSLSPKNYQYDSTTNTWSREFQYTNAAEGIDVLIRQKISTDEPNAFEKNYNMTFEIENLNSSRDLDIEFMFHADTAYNNNDYCEGYYIDGNQVTKKTLFSSPTSPLKGSAPLSDSNKEGVPDSFSIINRDKALAFTEKISFSGDKPDSLSMGHYNDIDEWDYYDNLDSHLGGNADNIDLGFSLYYTGEFRAGGNQKESYSFNYGIAAVEQDMNIKDVPLIRDNDMVVQTPEYEEKKPIWIQSGAEKGDGMYLTIDDMNCEVLGIADIDVSTMKGALAAIDATEVALDKIMSNRSQIGAQQNRLEHTIINGNNIIENTAAAESRIRDANMADEMVKYSNDNILTQVGQSMLAQANQSSQGVLALLR